jgi:hypothetical protein
MARQPFNTRWAQGVESEDSLNSFKAPNNDRLLTGWEGGQDKDAPPAGQENWWHNRVDSALQDVERQGAMTWHPLAVYGAGAPCYASDGYYYDSLSAGNTGNDPVVSPTYWRQIGQSLFSPYSVGEYKDVAHNGVPDAGWLKSNGAVLLRSAYPKLFAKIGTIYNIGGELSTQFRIPDWRGMFPRCLDDSRGVDPGRTLGPWQPSAVEKHNHLMPTSSGVPGGSAPGVLDTQWMQPDTPNFTPFPGVFAVSGDTGVSIYGLNGGTFANETRSINLAQVRWIRYL